MAGRDGNYPNAKIGFEQNNNNSATDRLYIDPDGYFNVCGGAGGGDITGQQMYDVIYKPLQDAYKPILYSNAGSLVSTMVNLLSNVGVVIFSVISNFINTSFWLTSCSAGRAAILMCRPGSATGQSAIIWVSTSGCSIISPITGGNISGFFMRTSSNSQVFVELKCILDDEWTVVDYKGGYAEA